ncbi:elongation factor 4 [Candidatus Curtissbacteria bacterium RIFCSPLOWO2_01_FULL_41_18]|uniref:Elongation factor 4 n=2 Tax=Candidatus Curtissiibacteriota TaxID=1752717 RepID=A0A1F5G2E7_9BACT|nr:MAG: elongation factor 4 [Candidatus Curtissbacteria bacterium RIFCSPHIGHO2_01_FULL_41_13]OGE05242.1 MAG: elongation factor 4 [Candidatus Curtissbacteria bacterium RIFCSPLOWO2_01_FULL_41_18]
MDIRNFAIVAHIDHGKSTLADRIMEICGAVGQDHPQQLLDSLELEREHGITIKLKAIRLNYSLDATHYTLNLIDTPGHVDFSYEVSRSLASVEGAVLLVDATQGIQAQTLANFNLSLEANLTIIPVVNKIDSPQANVGQTISELKSLGFTQDEIFKISAKSGEGVKELLNEIIKKVPPPKRLTTSPKLSVLIFDSALDPYKGVIATIRVFGGKFKSGDEILFLATGAKAQILQIGYLTPKPLYVKNLADGEVGFIVTNLKDLVAVEVGDTITLPANPAQPLPGYQQVKPVVFLSFYPADPHNLPKLKAGLEKLKLNDAAIIFAQESSISLGQGFRLGFLGLLHAQITQERLEREYDLDIIVTSPSVSFEIDGKIINKPQEFDPTSKNVREPYAKVTIFAPAKYYGAISNLIYEKRGEQKNLENVGVSQKIEAEIPLLEILIGFYDQLKTITSGYASFDFEIGDYRDANLVKLDILVNHEPVESLAQIIPKERAEEIARKLVEKLKEAIPRQQIAVPIQAAVGGKIIARETVASFRKDVTQKLYGGDVTRKMKLLEKQKKGKKRMRRFGNVDIPQEAFLAVLKI